MPKQSTPDISAIELRYILPLRTPTRGLDRAPMPSAEQITGLSRDVLRIRYGHLIRRLSTRRSGMQLGDCLDIADGKATPAA